MRGFTYKFDGSLDMRMNVLKSKVNTISACTVLVTSNMMLLPKILRTNSDFDMDDARRLAMSMLT